MKMIFHKALILIGGMMLMSGSLFSQLAEYPSRRHEELPVFSYDVVNLAGENPDESMLRVSMKIAYDELQFVREDDQYKAQYELTISIFDDNKNQIAGTIDRKTIELSQYRKTNSRKDFSSLQYEFPIPPGDYDVYIDLLDLDSKKNNLKKVQVRAFNYSVKQLEMSDIFLADYVAVDSTGQLLFKPNVSWNVEKAQEKVYLWFEIYNRTDQTNVPITYSILNHEGEIVRRDSFVKEMEEEKAIEIIQVRRDSLDTGRYRFVVEIGEGDQSVTRYRNFSINWADMPVHATSLDMAIDQMRYIATSKEIKTMKKSEGAAKDSLFKLFWIERDPTPETEFNELMKEYYRRVDFANTNFGSHNEGWRTDRGMVYIIVGPPDDIDRHPFDAGLKPYEVWVYHNLNKILYFMDYNGFGEYRLTPESWEQFNQIR